MFEKKYSCPCCGYYVFELPHGSYDICPICFWEDDLSQLDNPYLAGGANKISLFEAQRNYENYGACEKAFISNVRKPNKNDNSDPKWINIMPNHNVEERIEELIVDLKEVNCIYDLHMTLKLELKFPEFYGENWDAFWDSITGMITMPQKIIFIDSFRVEKLLGRDFRMMKQLLNDFNGEFSNYTCEVFYN